MVTAYRKPFPLGNGAFAVTLLSSLLLVAIHGPPGVGGLSTGAPESSCSSLIPGHKAQASPHPSPFALSLAAPGKNNKTTSSGNPKDRVIRVRIYSPRRIAFKGYIIRAEANGTNAPIGSFTFEDPSKAKAMSCGKGLANTVTHPDPKLKYFVDLDWHAPEDFSGIVLFNATVVQNYSTFWVGVVSDKIKIISTSPGTQAPKETSVPAAVTQSTVDLSPRISEEVAKLYEGCAITKLCFGMPDNCVHDGNCHTLVTILATGTQFEFELLAVPLEGDVKYVAVGLSADKDMGDDSVNECELGSSGVHLYTSYNVGKSNRRNPINNGVSLISSSYEDRVITCKFTREAVTVAGGKTYDLFNTPYHILLAAGDTLKPDSVGYHFSRRAYSESPQHLSVVGEVKGASKLLLHLHGAFMVAAWLLCASTGILLARYFKKTWTGRQTCGKDQWFAWHRFLMLLTWGLTIAGFVIIFVEIGEWSSSAGTHAILGTITTALAFIQPIMAAFRPAPTGKRRPLFNWAHWFVGNAAHILAVVTIFFAVKLVKAELPSWLDWVLVAYVAFYVFMHLIFSISGCLSERENTKRVNTFAMKDLSSSRSPLEMPDRNMDAPYAGLRKVLLALYIIGILALTIALIVIIALAPIEQNWERVTKAFTQS